MSRVMAALLAATGIGSGADAAITYSFTSNFLIVTGFTYQSPDFVASARTVPDADLSYCMAAGQPCTGIEFYSRPGYYPAYDEIFIRGLNGLGNTVGLYAEFDKGAFLNPGQYEEKIFGGTLFVRGTPDVPEIATWLMMLGGYVLIGAGLRQRRAARVVFE